MADKYKLVVLLSAGYNLLRGVALEEAYTMSARVQGIQFISFYQLIIVTTVSFSITFYKGIIVYLLNKITSINKIKIISVIVCIH